jgi:hypothetical protein
VTFRSTLRRSRKPIAPKAIGAQGTFSLPPYIVTSLLPPLKSLPFNLFADPHLLNPYATIFYKNNAGRGCASESCPTSSCSYALFANSLPCHTSENSSVSPIIATDPKTPSRKSFLCHTSKTPWGSFRSQPSKIPVLRTAIFKSLPLYFLASLLHFSRPIAPQSLWCNNLQRRETSSPSGETTPLPPVSKDSERTSGTVRWRSRLHPGSAGVASRAWVRVSGFVLTNPEQNWTDQQGGSINSPAQHGELDRAGKAGSVRLG